MGGARAFEVLVDDMNIWVTGCSAGLGRALVGYFVEKGHVVNGCARRPERIDELKKEFAEPHYFGVCDVSEDKEALKFCENALAANGPPDLVINNAAIINSPAPLWKIPADEFDRLMRINLSGTANIIRHVVPMMLEAGEGLIVNLSSGWGRSTSPEVAPYCASKWGIEGLTKALAQELPGGLAVVSLNPGVIDTEMLRSAWGEGAAQYQGVEAWVKKAGPLLLELKESDNGRELSVG